MKKFIDFGIREKKVLLMNPRDALNSGKQDELLRVGTQGERLTGVLLVASNEQELAPHPLIPSAWGRYFIWHV